MYLNVPASDFLVSILVLLTTSSSARNTQYDTNRIARQTSCPQLEFMCDNKECIPSYNVCDGAKDCSDGSDETRSACRTSGIKCPSLAFECSYGACIDRELRCNGQADCADGSDEDGCTTPATTSGNSCGALKFKCINGQCINRYDTCDGVKNCDDGSDETKNLCSILVCPSSSFQCDYGACLEPSVKCDGKPDCHDDSDELNCLHNNHDPRPSSTPSPEGGCRLPSQPKHGAYTALGQCSANDPRPACRSIPGTPVGNNWLLKYSCNGDYSLNKDSEFSVCQNGKWKNELDCIKLCPPLKSLSVNIKCIYNGKEVSCDSPMRPETKATPECKQYYRRDFTPDFKTMTCLGNGEWSNTLFQCTPACGAQKGGSLTPLAFNGRPSHQGEFPWLAGLYQLNNNSRWEQNCGGTLITPHIVLTAAHCLVNAENGPLHPSAFRVGLGKYYRNFYEKEPSTLISEVREVVTRKEFAGAATYFALDIGLLDLVVSVQVTGFIMPACVDWSNAFKPAHNALGVVAGWGTTERGTSSEVVLSSQLNYIGYDDCLKMIRGLFKGLLTHDKFCAGSGPSGNRVDKGDSGGGLTFIKSNQHFVIGVVSTKIPDETSFTLFTDITNTEHSSWLEEQRNRLIEAHHEL